MGLLGKSKREKELERQNALLRSMLAEKNTNNKSAIPKKTKYITRQCKYCGYRVTRAESAQLPGTACPQRKNHQPHIWQVLGCEYRVNRL